MYELRKTIILASKREMCFKLTITILEQDLGFMCFVNTLAQFLSSGYKREK